MVYSNEVAVDDGGLKGKREAGHLLARHCCVMWKARVPGPVWSVLAVMEDMRWVHSNEAGSRDETHSRE